MFLIFNIYVQKKLATKRKKKKKKENQESDDDKKEPNDANIQRNVILELDPWQQTLLNEDRFGIIKCEQGFWHLSIDWPSREFVEICKKLYSNESLYKEAMEQAKPGSNKFDVSNKKKTRIS